MKNSPLGKQRSQNSAKVRGKARKISERTNQTLQKLTIFTIGRHILKLSSTEDTCEDLSS